MDALGIGPNLREGGRGVWGLIGVWGFGFWDLVFWFLVLGFGASGFGLRGEFGEEGKGCWDLRNEVSGSGHRPARRSALAAPVVPFAVLGLGLGV